MYLRHSKVKKNGKTHTYWRLVRSVRQGSKVRQETVAYIGVLDAKERAQASALARHFLGERADQLDFFDVGGGETGYHFRGQTGTKPRHADRGLTGDRAGLEP